jgi:PAS domain S-box-containing protein
VKKRASRKGAAKAVVDESPMRSSFSLDLEPSALQMAFGPSEPEALESLLSQLVEAAGGQAGILSTSRRLGETTKTALFNAESGVHGSLIEIIEQAVNEAARDHEDFSPETLVRVERAARFQGIGRPLAIPVRSEGKAVGLLCLWHPQDGPSVLSENPGIYQLPMENTESTLRNARLLERLLNEKKWLEAAVQHSSDGVLIVDQQGTVVGYNLALSGLTGWKVGEAVGFPTHQAFPFALEETGSTALQLADGRQIMSRTGPVEARLMGKNGRAVDVELTSAPLFDRQSQPLGYVTTVRDIGARKELEALQKLFLSAVSHELQTPIAIIRGYAGLIADADLDLPIEVARSNARIIVEESQRLEQMVQQMLFATRIQAGGVQLNREILDLVSLVKRTLQRLHPVAESAGAKLTIDGPDLLDQPPIWVYADSEKILQVITNLVENAIKYGGKGLVSVSASAQAPWAVVSVTDQGPGIAPDEHAKIFTPFERGQETLKSRVRGAGLGLYICKAIIEAHDGRIHVDSHLGQGARFSFRIPLEMEQS